ncbi:MAG: hypothetical protein V9G10_13740 [Candidatus Nanopelagicales bacterium]
MVTNDQAPEFRVLAAATDTLAPVAGGRGPRPGNAGSSRLMPSLSMLF